MTFHVAERGLETSIVEVLTDAEFWARRPEEFRPNENWYEVELPSAADLPRWLALRNEQLRCRWTPNQTPGEQAANSARDAEITELMRPAAAGGE